MQQNTKEWLDLRKKKIGASDAPIIMGVSPWKTKYQLWQEKLNLIEPEPMNDSMARGKALEEKARACFEEKMGVKTPPHIAFHPTLDWMMASLDGYNYEHGILVEIKCGSRSDHDMAKVGLVPEKYYPQLQHQMEVIGVNLAYYLSFDGENSVVVEVQRNQTYIDQMIKEEKRFYDCMTNFTAPELTDKDFVYREGS